MLTRRNALLGAMTAVAATMAVPAAARSETLSTSTYRVPRRHLPRRVEVPADFQPGVIYALNARHQLYWVDGPGQAIRYVMAIGAEGRAFTGAAMIRRKALQPSWRPTIFTRAIGTRCTASMGRPSHGRWGDPFHPAVCVW